MFYNFPYQRLRFLLEFDAVLYREDSEFIITPKVLRKSIPKIFQELSELEQNAEKRLYHRIEKDRVNDELNCTN